MNNLMYNSINSIEILLLASAYQRILSSDELTERDQDIIAYILEVAEQNTDLSQWLTIIDEEVSKQIKFQADSIDSCVDLNEVIAEEDLAMEYISILNREIHTEKELDRIEAILGSAENNEFLHMLLTEADQLIESQYIVENNSNSISENVLQVDFTRYEDRYLNSRILIRFAASALALTSLLWFGLSQKQRELSPVATESSTPPQKKEINVFQTRSNYIVSTFPKPVKGKKDKFKKTNHDGNGIKNGEPNVIAAIGVVGKLSLDTQIPIVKEGSGSGKASLATQVLMPQKVSTSTQKTNSNKGFSSESPREISHKTEKIIVPESIFTSDLIPHDLVHPIEDLSPEMNSENPERNSEKSIADPIQQPDERRSVEFWQSAQKILQSQINLIDRLDRAFDTPDPNAVRAISGQIITHEIEVRRLSSGQYGNVFACPKNSVKDFLDVQIVCQIQVNAKILEDLQPALQDRIDTLGNMAYVKPLPGISSQSIINFGDEPKFERGSHDYRNVTHSINALNIPTEKDLLIRPKSALGDYIAPSLPALTAPLYVANTIDRLQTSVSDLQSIFPKMISFSQPSVEAAIADRRAYDVDPQDISRNKSFLETPHTGISRVHPSLAYNPDPNILRNRLAPSFEERHPYALLINPSDPPLPRFQGGIRYRPATQDTQRFPFVPLSERSFQPRLALQLNGNEFNLVNSSSNFDYGFMMDLGNLGQTNINRLSEGLPSSQIPIEPDIRSFFLGYRPPTTLEALKSERQRFLSGKAGPNNIPSLLSPKAPIQMGHTYLLRTLQFKMPDEIGSNKILPVQEGRKLDQVIAELKSKDLLVVFKPIERKADGSYNILWRVMGEFADPQISDLAQYVQFEH
jgi:hypothetical protein